MEVPIDDPVNGQSKAISCRKCGLNSGDVDAVTGFFLSSRLQALGLLSGTPLDYHWMEFDSDDW
jgi:hypothetical protein